jgi:hypothetical protein
VPLSVLARLLRALAASFAFFARSGLLLRRRHRTRFGLLRLVHLRRRT